jgi:hypothetical protein
MTLEAFEHWLQNDFPFEHIESSGAAALDVWRKLKAAGRGSPIVIGNDDDFRRVAEALYPWEDKGMSWPVATVAESLERAAALSWPQAIHDFRGEVAAEFKRQFPDFDDDEDLEGPIGEWPDSPPMPTALTVAEDYSTQGHLQKVHVLLIPTQDSTEIPAYLKWGGWNDCPPPEYHVAALRSWRDRYGAELVGMAGDVMNIETNNRPASRDEALALASEQYAYCSDIVDQGVNTISVLAAGLMANPWWFFWWD